jgi:hypothetical protein
MRIRKIEVPASYYVHQSLRMNQTGECYFEWHGRIPFDRYDELVTLVNQAGAHLSNNALRTDKTTRFVTLRTYGTYDDFQQQITQLTLMLEANGWPIQKQQSEYCVYDTFAHIDTGWIDKPFIRDFWKSSQFNLLANEGFVRRAVMIDAPFMLKGSLVTRQYMTNPEDRLAADLDWVYLQPVGGVENIQTIFDKWVQAVTEIDLDDGITFQRFSENVFWRSIDYAMEDDFPTVNTDLKCWVHGHEIEVLPLDISFNLAINQVHTTLIYKPKEGPEFVLPRTCPLALQIAWKFHQTLVRPRFKDIFDLIRLVQHPAVDETVRQSILQNLINECTASDIDVDWLNWFLTPKAARYKQLVEIGQVSDSEYVKFRRELADHTYMLDDISLDTAHLTTINWQLVPPTVSILLTELRQACNAVGMNAIWLETLPKPQDIRLGYQADETF